eukprot:TRINITY_DN18878_c0_g1_i2.p2 TRINITY_DN18878_c0_g1~~TRINITY_DN18878_c0_g1_i2.p2  ORF type:complete len:429 (-),score=82.09 TRINITY_DN18878_c0_g1_i2:381-1667(-)
MDLRNVVHQCNHAHEYVCELRRGPSPAWQLGEPATDLGNIDHLATAVGGYQTRITSRAEQREKDREKERLLQQEQEKEREKEAALQLQLQQEQQQQQALARKPEPPRPKKPPAPPTMSRAGMARFGTSSASALGGTASASSPKAGPASPPPPRRPRREAFEFKPPSYLAKILECGQSPEQEAPRTVGEIVASEGGAYAWRTRPEAPPPDDVDLVANARLTGVPRVGDARRYPPRFHAPPGRTVSATDWPHPDSGTVQQATLNATGYSKIASKAREATVSRLAYLENECTRDFVSKDSIISHPLDATGTSIRYQWGGEVHDRGPRPLRLANAEPQETMQDAPPAPEEEDKGSDSEASSPRSPKQSLRLLMIQDKYEKSTIQDRILWVQPSRISNRLQSKSVTKSCGSALWSEIQQHNKATAQAVRTQKL